MLLNGNLSIFVDFYEDEAVIAAAKHLARDYSAVLGQPATLQKHDMNEGLTLCVSSDEHTLRGWGIEAPQSSDDLCHICTR